MKHITDLGGAKVFRYEDLARAYQDRLGIRYRIKILSDIDFENEESIIQGVMYADETQFSIDINTIYSLGIYIEFEIPIEQEFTKHDITLALRSICGKLSGVISSNNKEYTYDSFLNMRRPITAPTVQNGEYVQVLSVEGTCFVSAVDGGAMMSNEIITNITINGVTGRVQTVAGTVSNIRDVESPTKFNNNESTAIVKTQGVGRNVKILSMRDRVCEEIQRAIENINSETELNVPVIIERIYPSFKSRIDCVLAAGSIIENPGAFLILDLNLQKRQ